MSRTGRGASPAGAQKVSGVLGPHPTPTAARTEGGAVPLPRSGGPFPSPAPLRRRRLKLLD